MKPRPMETIHTTHEGLPTVAATAPMENRTSGGTPLATQNAPVQSMPRSRPDALGSSAVPAAGRSFAVLLKLPPIGRWKIASSDTATRQGRMTLSARRQRAARGAECRTGAVPRRLWVRSPGGIVAAIDREIGAGHVARAVGSEEVHDPGHFHR